MFTGTPATLASPFFKCCQNKSNTEKLAEVRNALIKFALFSFKHRPLDLAARMRTLFSPSPGRVQPSDASGRATPMPSLASSQWRLYSVPSFYSGPSTNPRTTTRTPASSVRSARAHPAAISKLSTCRGGGGASYNYMQCQESRSEESGRSAIIVQQAAAAPPLLPTRVCNTVYRYHKKGRKEREIKAQTCLRVPSRSNTCA